MKTRILLMALAAWAGCLPVHAADHDYFICRVAGYYEGNHDQFLYQAASRVLAKNRLSTDEACNENIKLGREVGIKFSKAGKAKNEQEAAVLDEAAHFSNLIYDAILSKVKFD